MNEQEVAAMAFIAMGATEITEMVDIAIDFLEAEEVEEAKDTLQDVKKGMAGLIYQLRTSVGVSETDSETATEQVMSALQASAPMELEKLDLNIVRDAVLAFFEIEPQD